MHARFVIRRSPSGNHQIVDVHGNLLATMNGSHPDVEEITSLFVQSPIADYLARAAHEFVAGTFDAGGRLGLPARQEDWLESLEHYREALEGANQ